MNKIKSIGFTSYHTNVGRILRLFFLTGLLTALGACSPEDESPNANLLQPAQLRYLYDEAGRDLSFADIIEYENGWLILATITFENDESALWLQTTNDEGDRTKASHIISIQELPVPEEAGIEYTSLQATQLVSTTQSLWIIGTVSWESRGTENKDPFVMEMSLDNDLTNIERFRFLGQEQAGSGTNYDELANYAVAQQGQLFIAGISKEINTQDPLANAPAIWVIQYNPSMDTERLVTSSGYAELSAIRRLNQLGEPSTGNEVVGISPAANPDYMWLIANVDQSNFENSIKVYSIESTATRLQPHDELTINSNNGQKIQTKAGSFCKLPNEGLLIGGVALEENIRASWLQTNIAPSPSGAAIGAPSLALNQKDGPILWQDEVEAMAAYSQTGFLWFVTQNARQEYLPTTLMQGNRTDTIPLYNNVFSAHSWKQLIQTSKPADLDSTTWIAAGNWQGHIALLTLKKLN